VAADLEKLAYESALRALDKQERLVEELRARTGLVLAASSIAASLVGSHGPDGPGRVVLTLLAILGFVVPVAAAVLVLLPREDLAFSMRGARLFDTLPGVGGVAESLLLVTASLDRMWAANERTIQLLTRAFSVGAMALTIEIVALATLIGATLI
jgi:hypothetical protein